MKVNNIGSKIKLHQEEIKKDKPKFKILNIHLFFHFVIKYIGIFICILVLILCIKELNEYKEVFFTYNAMDQLNSMYKGSFTLLSPDIDTDERNVTQNRILLF